MSTKRKESTPIDGSDLINKMESEQQAPIPAPHHEVQQCSKSGKCGGAKSELSETAFRKEEKKYKLYSYDRSHAKRKPPPETDFSEVVDMRDVNNNTDSNKAMISSSPTKSVGGEEDESLQKRAQVRTFAGVPGLLFLPNYLPEDIQKEWAQRSIHQFSNSESFPNNITVLDPHKKTTKYESGMRWATLGFNYQWTSKSYNKESKSPFPEKLRDLCRVVVREAQAGVSVNHTLSSDNSLVRSAKICPAPYDPQTAIVNYFPVGAMMMAHQDISETSLEQPLVSMSIGSTAIFLMGTDKREDKPYAFYLRSGDVVVFTGPSRTAFHAVPRVLDDCPKFLLEDEDSGVRSDDKGKEEQASTRWSLSAMRGLRLNLNVRQVYPESFELPDCPPL